jgi:hypothetical protein
MIAGFDTYGASFPSVTAALKTDLGSAKASADGSRLDQEAKKATAKVATVAKDGCLDILIDRMKNALTLAQLDCNDNPALLSYIGWGPDMVPVSEPHAPVAPTALKITAEGPGDIWFSWEHENYRNVKHWLIQRRQQLAPGSDWGAWSFAASTLTNEAHLVDQPVGTKLEYRVIAENSTGQSDPGNTVAAVL